MRVYVKEHTVSTRSREDIVNITRLVEDTVRESGIKNGIVLVYVPHATALLIVNEDEPGLRTDYLKKILEIFPRDGDYLHNRIDDNGNAHLASAFIGSSRVFPLVNGRIVRGTWQEIMLVDLDGPRTRRVVVEVMGE